MKIKNLNINYIQSGKKGAKDIVLLHGWGQNTKMMEPLAKGLSDNYFITNIDLPGFGESDEPLDLLTLNDYTDIISELLDKLEIKNPIIIGHSFGGRIGIIYAAKEKTNKLVLLGSPFFKSDRKPSAKVKLLKTIAKVPGLKLIGEKMKNKLGSTDYRNASPVMKKVLVSAVNTDLTNELKMIKAPTLLIWGSADTAVSIEDAAKAEKLIPNAGLVVYDNRTHYAYLEELGRTVHILKEFFKNKKEGE